MDGRLLVLCDERPTIDCYGNRINEQGNRLYPKKMASLKMDKEMK